MKKRYILFGYQIQNGEFCIVQQEGAAVEYIFDAYSNGDSLQQIATHMSSCGPPYRSSDNRWNKNIIARLLSCDIYCGTAVECGRIEFAQKNSLSNFVKSYSGFVGIMKESALHRAQAISTPSNLPG